MIFLTFRQPEAILALPTDKSMWADDSRHHPLSQIERLQMTRPRFVVHHLLSIIYTMTAYDLLIVIFAASNEVLLYICLAFHDEM